MKKIKKSTLTIDRKLIILGGIAVVLILASVGLKLFQNQIIEVAGVGYAPSMGIAESYPDVVTDGSGGVAIDRIMTGKVMNTTPPARQKIDTANLSLLVDSVSDSISAIKSIALATEGYVGNSNIYETGTDLIQGNITIRVPSANFDLVLEQIKNLAVKVENESTNADDVTEQLIDINSRIANLKILEEQYRKILKTADKTEDILKVTDAINNVRQQIESLEGQLKYIDQAVAMSSITVSLKAVADVQVFGLTWKPLLIIKQALNNMVAGILDYVETIIYIAFYIPVLLIWLATATAVVFGGYKLYQLLRKKIK